MAIKLVTAIKRFIGTAAEIAGLSLTEVPAASTAYDTTNKKMQILDSAGNWVDKVDLVQLSGRIVEYAWFDGDAEPTPTEAFAWGVKFNKTTGVVTNYGWSGTAWVEVV